MVNRIEMLNRALLRIGSDPLQSEADAGAPVHLAVYDSIIEYLTGVHPWSFFRTTRQLMRLSAAPTQHYQYAFQLPSDRIGAPRAVYPTADVRKPTIAYHLAGDQLLSDLPQIWLRFMVLRDPNGWPGDFREGFTLLLMSELALSIREDRPLRNELRVQALGTPQEQPHGGVIGVAISCDSQAEPSTEVGGGDNPLIDVRY